MNVNYNQQTLYIKSGNYVIDNLVLKLIEEYRKSFTESFCELKKLKKNIFTKNIYFDIRNCFFDNIRIIKIFENQIKLYKSNNIKKYEMNEYNYPIENDLNFNELKLYNEKDVIHIRDIENKIYWSFYNKDLIQILKISIENNEDKFPKPMCPKNPYTNQEFTIPNLYKIFSNIKNLKLPLSLWLYYKYNFNKKMMLKYHWDYFIKISASNYVKKLDYEDFVYELQNYLDNLLCSKDYDWYKISKSTKLIYIFQDIIIKLNLYETEELDIRELKEELLLIIKNNDFIRKKINFKKKHTSYIFVNNQNLDDHIQNGVFMFGGNDNYRLKQISISNEINVRHQIADILDSIISNIQTNSICSI